MRQFVVWFAAGALQALGILLPTLYSTEAMRSLRWAAVQLVPDNPIHRVFITQVCDASPLTCSAAWVLPASRPTALALTALIGGTLVPGLYLDCYGVRLVDVLARARRGPRGRPVAAAPSAGFAVPHVPEAG